MTLGRDVLGGDHGALDDEDVEAGLERDLVVALDLLRGERRGGDDAVRLDLLDPPPDQLLLDGLLVDLLHLPRGLVAVERGDALELGLRVLVAGPDALEVQDREAAELADDAGRLRRDDAVHRRREQRELEAVRARASTRCRRRRGRACAARARSRCRRIRRRGAPSFLGRSQLPWRDPRSRGGREAVASRYQRDYVTSAEMAGRSTSISPTQPLDLAAVDQAGPEVLRRLRRRRRRRGRGTPRCRGRCSGPRRSPARNASPEPTVARGSITPGRTPDAVQRGRGARLGRAASARSSRRARS